MAQPLNLPDWLKPGARLPGEESLRLTAITANWVRLFAARKQLTEIDCLRIIVMELNGRKRPEMIGRIKVWYDKLRSQREIEELWAVRPGAPILGQAVRK